jgi:hypothetical protein
LDCGRRTADAAVALCETVERESVLTIQQYISRMFVSRVRNEFVAELRDVLPAALRQHGFKHLQTHRRGSDRRAIDARM